MVNNEYKKVTIAAVALMAVANVGAFVAIFLALFRKAITATA